MRFWAVSLSIIFIAQPLAGSWLSDFTGINVDLANPGTPVTIGRPDFSRFGEFLRNLPKDAAQFVLAPQGTPLSFLIRRAKNQAKASCKPIPQPIERFLQRVYPTAYLAGVCYALHDPNGITLDALLLAHLGQGAVTLEDVIVYKDARAANDPILWAHEIMHVVQYRMFGLETFAYIYSTGIGAIQFEEEARKMEKVAELVAKNPGGDDRMWSGNSNPPPPISAGQMAEHARQALPPGEYCAAWRMQRELGRQSELLLQNGCPVPITLVNITLRDNAGKDDTVPCGTAATCTIPPKGMVAMPLTPWPNKTPVRMQFRY